ncbi:MAG: hypothetical protein ACTSSH_03975 [Candidatus Heimdallarchaeota archaeon]
MSIRESEEKLFFEWKMTRSDLVTDGVVDEESYLQSPLKLLFVLKEVNDQGGGGWDLREYIKEGCRAQTWNNVTRWVEGIRCLYENIDDINWSEFGEIDGKRRSDILKSIVTVNLKKSPGGHTADPLELDKIAKEDNVFLNSQMSLYDPDITICCGTSDLFHSIIKKYDNPEWKQTKRGVYFHEHKPNKYIVEFSHPEVRCAPSFIYYGLIDAIREILAK